MLCKLLNLDTTVSWLNVTSPKLCWKKELRVLLDLLGSLTALKQPQVALNNSLDEPSRENAAPSPKAAIPSPRHTNTGTKILTTKPCPDSPHQCWQLYKQQLATKRIKP